MKRITPFVLTLLMGFLGMNQGVNGQTKVFDQTITWEHAPYDHGGYGFYWWHRTDGHSIINYGDMPSDNWVSPNNYYNGEFTLSVEVVSQPSDDPFWIQFGIWADYSKGSLHTETVAARQYVNGGSGSSGSWSLGSPSGWWNKQPSDPLDFSRADDFYRIGVVLWNTDPLCIPMGTEWNADGCPEFGDKFFPMTVRIRVYASSGVYVPPITAPNYSIDYSNERTNKVISSDDQYSYNSNFSSVTDGDGQYLSLTPGTNVYFRKKADYSKTQTLTVPYRPGAPGFGIDFANERTSETVSSEYQFSSNSDMSSATTGDGSYVSLSPGASKYFRKLATSSNFASDKQSLSVPGRPAAPSFGIDYPNERTNSVVSSDYLYSANSDMSSATAGDGSYVSLTPGSDIYIRKVGSASAFASNIQELLVPSRAAAPTFAIDFTNERTSSVVEATHEYASSSDMSDVASGTGAYVTIGPGTNRYFKTKPTASAFLSDIQTLAAPARPAAPSFLIDFVKEEVSVAITNGYQYGNNSDLSDATQGSGSAVKITPGINMYLQALASSSVYASEIQMLVSPARPTAPTVSIDYVNETSGESISTGLQYSGSAGFETAEHGTGVALDLTPGVDIYFRHIASTSYYASESFQLVVPDRPVIFSGESGTTTLRPFLASIIFSQEVAALDAATITVVNAELNNLALKSMGSNETVFEGLVYATANDVISITVLANSVQEGNFVSDIYEIYFSGTLPGVGVESPMLTSFSVFPNPGKGVFRMKYEGIDDGAIYKLEVCSITGNVAHTETFYGSDDLSLDLSGLSDGIYLLRLSEDEQIKGTVKLIIK